MDGERAMSAVATPTQWGRCAHRDTMLLDGGGVGLDWSAPVTDVSTAPAEPSGLVFDRRGVAYRSWPDRDRVEPRPHPGGAGAPWPPGVSRRPLGLAVDERNRLYVTEARAGIVRVVDLEADRVLRAVPLASSPLDVAADGAEAVVLTRADVLLRIRGRRGPIGRVAPVAPAPGLAARRVAVLDGEVLVLWSSGEVADVDGRVVAAVDGATDLETVDGVLVVARGRDEVLRRFRRVPGRGVGEIEPLGVRDHDGGAIAATPDGGVAVTTPWGYGRAAGPRVRYPRTGRVVTYRLDARRPRTRWGRVFLDACVPAGTDVRLRFLTAEEDDATDPLPWAPPARTHVGRPDPAPQLPSISALAELTPRRLYRRPTGREWPWAQVAGGDTFETYESPVHAPPGRYLWIVLELTGGEQATPRIRALRVERPGHRLLDMLPRAWSRHEADAGLLHRALAPAEGLLHEIDERAARRSVLVDPVRTPSEALPWLARMLGVALDGNWPEDARRRLLAEAFELYRYRGTVRGLQRMLELALGVPLTVVEAWRLRGLGGAVLGALPSGRPAPAVGATAGRLGGFRVGGQRPGTDGYTATAHRFTVLVPGCLDRTLRARVDAVLEAHQPAHTVAEVCELGIGMVVGQQAHIGLTTFVGPPPGHPRPRVGEGALGEDAVAGTTGEGARLGVTSRTGGWRVG
ncbi:phage tail protein I [Actinomycetospora lemnae]|uniref:Phage tail protein I n=1 Tax=Actinomycetospora lemnae TaxID=3019891 RepID=A0ABT5STJ3_9PSEU|nr:phage tail protein I [Actinomycetospora sp. DW7H6]MDD7965491.1 phage tail protein I [Actinomycetospora sp. DW7H6]